MVRPESAKLLYGGSIPPWASKNPSIWIVNALLAQLVEQLPLKEMVVGSNPTRGTKPLIKRQLLGVFGFVNQSDVFV